MKQLHATLAAAAFAVAALAAPPAQAEGEIIKVRIMSSDLAAKIAQGAVHACRDKGYQASAVVLDRAGKMIAAQRTAACRSASPAPSWGLSACPARRAATSTRNAPAAASTRCGIFWISPTEHAHRWRVSAWIRHRISVF